MNFKHIIEILDVFRENPDSKFTIRQISFLSGLPYTSVLRAVNTLLRARVLRSRLSGRGKYLFLSDSIQAHGFMAMIESVKNENKEEYMKKVELFARRIKI